MWYKKHTIRTLTILHIYFYCRTSFQNTNVFKTGLSNFHKVTVSVLKLHFPTQKTKIVSYRIYKRWVIKLTNSFRYEFDDELCNYTTYIKNYVLYNTESQHLPNIVLDTLNKHAPIKKKYSSCITANQSSFMTRNEKI